MTLALILALARIQVVVQVLVQVATRVLLRVLVRTLFRARARERVLMLVRVVVRVLSPTALGRAAPVAWPRRPWLAAQGLPFFARMRYKIWNFLTARGTTDRDDKTRSFRRNERKI